MKSIYTILILCLLVSCSRKKEVVAPEVSVVVEVTAPEMARAKNVILMIGDGMGLGQITAGLYANGNKLHLERMKYIGFHKSYSANDLITDSAAGATAFATGEKTYNGAIAVDVDTMPLPTILEEAEEKGMETGLVSTSSIVHATPASFIAHNKSRRNYDEIAADFLKTDVDVFIGGGKKFFQNRKTDDRDLYEELTAKGYLITDFFEQELEDVVVPRGKKWGHLTANDGALSAEQGRTYLPLASERAIEVLQDAQEGFFLMVEGSQIDWGGHNNNANYIITEMIDFDNAVGRVLDWAEKNGNTLVVVTADHETGGFSINKGSTMDSLVTAFTSDYHTGTMIPVFAFGPGAENFMGIYENTAIYDKMRKAYGWEE